MTDIGELLDPMRDKLCVKCGAPRSIALMPLCADCNASRLRENKILEQAMETKRIENNIETLLEKCGVAKRYQNATFENYVALTDSQHRVLGACKSFVDNFVIHECDGTWVAMIGGLGTGKTHLTSAIIRGMIEKGKKARVWDAMRLIREIKTSWQEKSKKSESDIVSEIDKLDLLIIEEIGVQFQSKFEQDFLFDLFNSRYANQKPLIITSNLNFQEICTILGDRFADRFRDGKNKILKFDWGSYRKNKN